MSFDFIKGVCKHLKAFAECWKRLHTLRATLFLTAIKAMQRKWYIGLLLVLSIALFSVDSATGQATGTITGVVTDSTAGQTIPGANILIVGTQQGTTTGSGGAYSLDVEPGTYDVQVSFVGFTTETRSGVEVQANQTTRVDFQLVRGGVQLEEVVAVGYTQRRAQDLTGSVSTVSSGDIEDLPVAGVDRALEGQVSGVQINQGSGVPGGGPQIRIRGAGSIGAGTDPLYVLDGFALPSSSGEVNNPINDIPPSDIESVTVLKDASATAIYGSRGANGVVLIETKSGSSGDIRVNVSSNYGVQQLPSVMIPEMAGARQFAQWRKDFEEGQAEFENRPVDVPEAFQNPEEYGEGADWVDAVTRNAQQYEFNVSVQGGGDNVQSFVSAGYTSQEGLVEATDYERFSLRANVDIAINEMFSAGVRVSPTFSQRTQSSVGGDGRYEAGFGNALVASPLEPVFEEDGSFNLMTPDSEDDTGALFPYPNPLQTLKQLQRDRETLRGIGSAFIEFRPVDALTVETRINADWQDVEQENFDPSTVGNLFEPPPTQSTGSYFRSGYSNWLSETTLSYSETLGEAHSLEAVTGVTFQQQTSTNAGLNGSEFPGDEVRTLNAAADISGDTGKSEWSLLSFLGRVDYSYGDRYLVTATVRRDGSSRFGSGNRWGTFPSLAVGWRLSEEAFLEDAEFLSNLKIRLSYGQNGNFNIGNFTYAGGVGISNYVTGGSIANGRTVNSLRNPDLGWEESREYNVGIESSFFDSRITASIDLYRRLTEELLFNVEVPQSSGFSSAIQNRGEIQNQGVEVSINTVNIQTEDLSWDTQFNISSNANEVLELGPENEPIIAGDINAGRPTHITEVGGPIGQFYGWQIEGLYDSEEEIRNNPSYDEAQVGNIRPIDVNGDGELTKGGDFTKLGNPYPDFTFGLTNTFNYRNFDLRVLLSGSYGGKRMQGSHEWFWNIDGVFNVPAEYIEDRWRSADDPGDGVTPKAVGPSTNRLIYRDPNSLSVQDNSHLWLKNITLGYTLPSSLVGTVAQRARVYTSVRNAFILTDYDGGNPQATNYQGIGGDGQQLTPGLDYSTYPVPRTITVGAKLNF